MQPKLYGKLAPWFHLLTAPEDYAEEAAFYTQALIDACERRPRTVVELGSGGGNNASHMKRHFRMTLVDLSPEMLKLSRSLNPTLEHVQGDMRTVRLGREFDAVFVHDAVMYMTTERDLRAAIETAHAHCRPGGGAVFVPDGVRESFRASTIHGGHDGERRALRYLAWTYDPDPNDTTYVVDFAYLLRDARGRTRVERDRHIFGLFGRNDWRRLLREAGFRPTVRSFRHSDVGGAHEVFVARRPD